LAGFDTSSGTCGLIGGYTTILPFLIGVAWLFQIDPVRGESIRIKVPFDKNKQT